MLLYTYKLMFEQEKIRGRLSNNYYEASWPHKCTVIQSQWRVKNHSQSP